MSKEKITESGMAGTSSFEIDDSHNKYEDPNYIPKSESVVSNFIPKKRMERLISKILDVYQDSIGHTLGPRGTFNLIQNPYLLPRIYASKDGNEGTVNVKFSESVSNCIKDLVLEIANHMQSKVGDGTTSGFPILNTLYKEMRNKLDNDPVFKYVSPGGLEHIYDEIFNYFNKYIFTNYKTYASKLEDFSDEEKIEIIKKIASISANNNPEIAKNVSELFINKMKKGEESGVDLVIKPQDGEEDEIEMHGGFELPFGHVDESFANQQDQITLKYDEKTAFLFIRGPVGDSDKDVITEIIKGVTDGNVNNMRYKSLPTYPLIIVADSFSSNMIGHVAALANGQIYSRPRVEGEPPEPIYFKVSLLSMKCLQGNPEKERFYDLIAATGATPIDGVRDKIQLPNINTRDTFYNTIHPKLGFADYYESNMYHTKIIGGDGKEEIIAERIEYILKQIDSLKNSKTAFSGSLALDPAEEFYSRISMLKRNMSRIKVGGINLKVKKRRRSIYDDVIRAIQSSIKRDGFILGGNVNITWTLNTREKRENIAKEITKILIEKNQNIIPMMENRNEKIFEIVESTLESVFKAFKTSYLLALENSFRDKDMVNKIYDECMKADKPVNYNIITGEYKGIDLTDIENKCSSLLVPLNTDIELMKVIFLTLIDLITVGAGLGFFTNNVSFQDYLNAVRKQ